MPVPPRPLYSVPLAHGRSLALGGRVLVMGVINISPDSFAESRRLDVTSALDAALQMEAAGADLIDVGGESTRPGTQPVSADDEIARVVPVIEALARRARLPVSVDTYKAAVARLAVAAGASIVNDVSGLQYDPQLGRCVADSGAGLVLMHTRGRSSDMYAAARYDDIVSEVTLELEAALVRAEAAGVPRERTLVDPGIGFAKRPEHSYGVLARLSQIARVLGRPTLVGPSRKSFMSEALAGRPANERDWGTAAAVTAAVLAGAHVIRVHAVSEMVQVVRVAEEIRKQA